MLGAALPALDLSALLQFVFTALLILSGVILVVKRAASKYFVVDAGFEGGAGYDTSRRGKMSIASGVRGGDGGQADGGTCATCGNPGNKKCSRCKTVRYCSLSCQSKHWEADHRYKCKQLKLSDKAEIISSGNVSCRRRKSSGFSSISLVPARGTFNALQEPKKILFPYDEFLKLYNWDNPGFPPCGLVNCGNSCFANVVLQCLACTRPLIAYLLERDHSIDCIRKRDDWCFLCELQVHIQRASGSSRPFSPLKILSRLPNIGGNLGCGRQEDAHEFMRFAIDTMQSVCLDQFGGEKAIDFSTQETTLIQYIFGGHLQSQVTCTECNMISNRYENMMDLTVEIQGDVESLEECLEQFTVKEWLDGENKYKCDGCNDYVKAWKRLTVHQAPNILTIALKRFQSGRFGKLNKRVSFPEKLDLTPYMSGNGDGTDQYTLYAVVVHVDMLNASFFGHYICYTKDFYGQWYRIDDCKVMRVEVEDVLSEGAYMLLYSRRTARKEPFIKPVEPQRNRQSNYGTPNSYPVSVSALPLDVDTPLNLGDISPIRDDGNKIKSSADVESPKVKELSKMVLDSPVTVKEGLAGMEVDDVSVSSQAAKESEEEIQRPCSSMLEDMTDAGDMQLNSQEISTHEIYANDNHEPSASSDVSNHVEEDSESYKSRAASGLLLHTSDEPNFNKKNETDSEPSLTSLAIVKSLVSGTSDDTMTVIEHSVEICNESESAIKVDRLDDACPGNECGKTLTSCQENGSSRKSKPIFSSNFLNGASLGSEDEKTFPSHQENGFRKPSQVNKTFSLHCENGFSKQKPLFSRGFLDKPTKMKSLGVKKTQNESHLVDHVPKENGYSNGHSELALVEQELPSSDNSNDQDPSGAHFNGPSLQDCHFISEEKHLRVQNSHSNGGSVETNHVGFLDSAFVNETCNGTHKKDESFSLLFENNCNLALGEKS